MKKAFNWLWLIAALILLAACGSQTDVVTDAGQTETTPAEELPPTVVAESPAAAPAAADFTPAMTLAEASLERPRDYVQGAEDPLLTVIEYGDFQ